MSHHLCPSCSELVPGSALRCSHCRELLRDYRECPDCQERVRAAARVCCHCGFRFARTAPPPVPVPSRPAALPAPPASSSPSSTPATGSTTPAPSAPPAAPSPADATSYAISATPLRGVLAERSLTPLVAPPELRLSGGIVSIRRWFGLGLSSEMDRVPVSRVSAVRLQHGLFSAGIHVDAPGHPGLQIAGLSTSEAAAMAELLRRAAGQAPAPAPTPSIPSTQSPSTTPSAQSTPPELPRAH